MKKQNKNSTLSLDEIGYKKAFLARKIQENEADNEIKDYKGRVASAPEVPSSQYVDEEGSVRNLSS